MKKILCLVVVFVLLMLTACAVEVAPEPATRPEPTAVAVKSTESVPESTEAPIISPAESEDISYAGLIPDPTLIFANANICVTDSDGGTAYMFEVMGYAEGEYEQYILQCKQMGFEDVSYETGSEFGAYSADALYWVQVNVDDEAKTIYVICQTSKHHE